MASDLDLDSIYTFALQLGKDAGQMLLEAAQRRMSGDDQLVEEEKLNSVDIVTKTDEGEFCVVVFLDWEIGLEFDC
jgi:myo-inositol-1(or 4)-monophosphatase